MHPGGTENTEKLSSDRLLSGPRNISDTRSRDYARFARTSTPRGMPAWGTPLPGYILSPLRGWLRRIYSSGTTDDAQGLTR